MQNLSKLKFDKSTKYLDEQLLVQNNNKQLILDIITNIGLLINNSQDDEKQKYETVLDEANRLLQEITNNITTIEQSNLEMKNITKDLASLLSEQNKRTKTKEFFIASISNIQNTIVKYTNNLQNVEKKLTVDNEAFNEFISQNNFQYNFNVEPVEEDVEINLDEKYEFSSFSINNEEAEIEETIEDVEFVDHEFEAFAEDILLEKVDEKDKKIDELTAKFKDLLKNYSESEEASSDMIQSFLDEHFAGNPFKSEDQIELSEEDILNAITEDDLFDEELLADELADELLEEPISVSQEKTREADPILDYIDIEDAVALDILTNMTVRIYNRFEKNPKRYINKYNPFYDEDNILEMQDIAKSSYYGDDYDAEFASILNNYKSGINYETEETVENVESIGIDEPVKPEIPTAFDSMAFLSDVLNGIEQREAEEKALEEEMLKEELMKDVDDSFLSEIVDDFDVEEFEEAVEAQNNFKIEETAPSKYEQLRKNIIGAVEDNKHLFISEKTHQIFLPYKISELEEYMKVYPDAYPVIQDVVEQEFTFNYDYFNKHPMQSRFKELYILLKDREGRTLQETIPYALKLAKRNDLNPAVIASCKTQHELESYIYYLDEENLSKFKFFDIIYEIDDSNKL